VSDQTLTKRSLSAALLVAALLAGCGQQAEPPPASAPAATPAATPSAGADQPPPVSAEKPRAPVTVTLTDADDGRAVALQRGQGVEMRLAADRMAGYTWIPAQSPLPVMNTDGVPLFETEDGSGAGTEVWRFIALEPGHAHLVFEYRRPFEPGVPPQKSVTFHFDVE
jgi:predicted secreted protein